jgi:hypothetical protein
VKTVRIPSWISAVGVAAIFAFAAPSTARADDAGGKEEPSPVKAQMRKIVRLMRENEEALLEASRGEGGKAKPVDVTAPPVAPDRAPPPAATNGEAPKSAGEPGGKQAPAPLGEKGASAAGGLDDLLAGAGVRGANLRREIEELLRMIPT